MELRIEPDPGAPRPLVYRVAAMGDTILLTALLRALAEIWQCPCDVVVKSPWEAAVLPGLDSVGERISISSRRTAYWLCPSQQRLVAWLRRRGATPTYVVDGLDKELWLLRRGGVPDGLMVTDREAPWSPLQLHYHHLLEFARHAPPGAPAPPGRFPEPPPTPELKLSQGELEECRDWLRRRGWQGEALVVFQTQSRRKRRGRWPVDRWSSAIRTILDRVPGSWGLLNGARNEAPDVERIRDACRHPRLHNIAGELPIRRLFALLALAHSCVSLDTGPAHAAAALGCPTVVLVGMADPRRYRPVGPPGMVEIVVALPERAWPPTWQEFEATHRMEEIELAAVLAAWERLHHRG